MSRIRVKDNGLFSIYPNILFRGPQEFHCPEEKLEHVTSILDEKGIAYEVIEGDVVVEAVKAPPTPPVDDVPPDGPPLYNPNKDFSKYVSDNGLVSNLKEDPKDERDFLVRSVLNEPPDKLMSSGVEYKDEMSPVKDQGQLGSCVGFAVAAMKEWQESTEHLEEVAEGKDDHRDGKVYDYSEQWIYYNCKAIDPWPDEEGTSIRYAFSILRNKGVPTESAWPYSDVEIGEPQSWSYLIARWASGGSYFRIASPEELVQTLIENGPCVIGIYCFYEIFYPRNGIVDYPEDPQMWYGGHAICITGWDPITRMFTFKNSWSKYWGDGGYGYLPYEFIKDFMLDAWVLKDIAVSKDMLVA